MTEKLDKLMEYLQFPAVRYAIIVGLLISLCSSLLGVTLVMKRFSFIGDGLSHVAFGAMAIATVLNVTDNMLVIMPVTVVSAVLLLRTGQNTRIKGDAAVAMISVGALALGYLMMNLAPKNGRTSANLSADVCSTLFGSTSILTLSQKDVITCVIMSAIVVAVFFFFYTKIFAVTFDESFAKATGIRSDLYNLLIAVVIAVIIVFAMNFVGSLLISALIIFPALSAMRVFKSFRSVIVCSVIISLFCASTGLILAILEGTPVGSTIVAADIAVFFIFSIVSMVARRGEK
ncbi:MAG: High-affinity zinc uptake system membrane protein ZnuB [Firmicutes bacterium ADurb.BinA205]|nr:MAG: High-affinity zinc uptake system membrane protein ZnuB [Firmicutes bacterium ADurb.BinA205]HOC34511.1 metal ABC transporter permease [Ruminococcus flavefaciens]HQM02707.1 metal ABC transporter permease [Ruminococcus flavefaciens]